MVLHVAIIGAGISGCAMARGLRDVPGVVTTVYEADAGCDVREQGYSLTMQQGGRKALGQLGVAVEGKGGKGQIVLRGDGRVLADMGGTGKNVFVPRQTLRKTLVEGTAVRWGWQLRDVTSEGGNVTSLTFCNGEEVHLDLVIAADGARSTLRTLLSPDVAPQYLGVFSICGVVAMPGSGPLSRHGSAQVLQDGLRLFTKPFVCGERLMWQLTFKAPEDAARLASTRQGPGQLERKQSCLAQAASLTTSWADCFTSLIASTPAATIRGGPIYDMPLVQQSAVLSARPSNVVYMGDAIHAMSPFKGQGANTALEDAELVVGIIRGWGQGDGPNELAAYHASLPQRVAHAVSGSRRNVEFYHSYEAADDNAVLRRLGKKK